MSRTGTAGPPGLAMDWDFGALSACLNTDILEQTIRRMAWATFDELRLEDEFCDVTIKVDDVEFKARKIILSVGSLYFRSSDTGDYSAQKTDILWLTRGTAEAGRMIALCSNGSCINLAPKPECYHSHVRLALINTKYLMNNMITNIHVKDNKECMNIVTSVLKTKYDLNANGSSRSDFMNPLTRPRLPSAILLAVGGWSSNGPTNAMESYDCRVDRWVDITYDMESPRAYHGTAYLNGYVYLVGGFNGMDFFNSVRRFDPVKKIWQQVAPMNHKPCYVSTAVLENRLYAMDGFDGHICLKSAECYDPETNQWDLIAPMNEIRSDAKATTPNGKIYICGGFTGEESLFTAEVYNPDTEQWSMIAPMRSRRSGVGVIAYGDLVYAVGGFDGVIRLCSADAYNPANNSWTEIASMFSPRSNFGIELLEDLLYVPGGFNGFRTTFKAEYYDRKTNEWYGIHNMNIHRSALDCCVLLGLPNVRDYATSRDTFYREEARRALSDSSL